MLENLKNNIKKFNIRIYEKLCLIIKVVNIYIEFVKIVYLVKL